MGREQSIQEMEELLLKLSSLSLKNKTLQKIFRLLKDKEYDEAKELLRYYNDNLKGDQEKDQKSREAGSTS